MDRNPVRCQQGLLSPTGNLKGPAEVESVPWLTLNDRVSAAGARTELGSWGLSQMETQVSAPLGRTESEAERDLPPIQGTSLESTSKTPQSREQAGKAPMQCDNATHRTANEGGYPKCKNKYNPDLWRSSEKKDCNSKRD